MPLAPAGWATAPAAGDGTGWLDEWLLMVRGVFFVYFRTLWTAALPFSTSLCAPFLQHTRAHSSRSNPRGAECKKSPSPPACTCRITEQTPPSKWAPAISPRTGLIESSRYHGLNLMLQLESSGATAVGSLSELGFRQMPFGFGQERGQEFHKSYFKRYKWCLD